MNSLYGVECGLPARLDAPNHSISFDADTIAAALVNIYQKKYGNGKEIEPTLFEKTKEIFEGAINKGVKQSSFSIDTAFKHQLTHNMWVFSAFRTHKMQRDIAKYLLNEKGELKPFTKFVKDVAPYIKHTNRLWLETEYNTAVLRAHQAADWRKFVDERDVLPNLEWQPSTSTNPGEDHKPYWFTCLPINHKFWKQHRPGDRWNCKCSLRNTDKEPTPVPADTIIKGSEPQRGLESNPGEKGEIFSDNHPYFPENCGKCPFNKGVGRLFAALVGGKNDCNECGNVNEAMESSDYHIIQRKEASIKINEIITQIQNRERREYICIPLSKIDQCVLDVLKRENIDIDTEYITISTDRISHAIRPYKTEKNKALLKEDFVKLPSIIDQCNIYYDISLKNFWYIYKEKDKVSKYVFGSYIINGNQEFTLITAGIISECNLYQKGIIKIK